MKTGTGRVQQLSAAQHRVCKHEQSEEQGECHAHVRLDDAEARRVVVQAVAAPTRPRLLSTARTTALLRMSARKASYHALCTTSSRSASAEPEKRHNRLVSQGLHAARIVTDLTGACEQSACHTPRDGMPGEMVGTMSALFTMVVTYGAHERASSSVMQAGHATAKHVACASSGAASRSLRASAETLDAPLHVLPCSS